jgi:hypothetical protein
VRCACGSSGGAACGGGGWTAGGRAHVVRERMLEGVLEIGKQARLHRGTRPLVGVRVLDVSSMQRSGMRARRSTSLREERSASEAYISSNQHPLGLPDFGCYTQGATSKAWEFPHDSPAGTRDRD